MDNLLDMRSQPQERQNIPQRTPGTISLNYLVSGVAVATFLPVPLTTKFIAPSGCFADSFTLGAGLDRDQNTILTDASATVFSAIFRGARSECYPSSFSVGASSFNYTDSRVTTRTHLNEIRLYSPGVCPERYTPLAQEYFNAQTFQTCCPV